MPDQKSQGISEGDEKEPGGYMAVYHDIEEICYGPESGMPEIMRVFLCIRHKLLRDGLCHKMITYKFISSKTGLLKKNIIPCMKKLEKAGWIIITKNKKDLGNGKFQYFDNSYSLNPAKFGNLYNWYNNNPTLRSYSKDKAASYSKKGLPNNEGVHSIWIEDEDKSVVSDKRLGVVSDPIPGVVSDERPQNGLKLSELLSIIVSNNPSSNNPKENNPSSEDLKSSQKEGKKRTQEEHEAIIKQQIALAKSGQL